MINSFLLAAAAAVGFVGDFTYAKASDPMSDAPIVAAILTSGQSKLTLACALGESNSVFVRFETDQPLNYYSEENRPFEYRIDQGRSATDYPVYQPNSVVMNPIPGRILLEQLAKGSRIVIRAEGRESYVVADFPALGAREAIATLASDCGDTRLLKRLAR